MDRPIIISGWSDKPMITREEIVAVCGDRPLHDAPCDPDSLPVKYHVPDSQELTLALALPLTLA